METIVKILTEYELVSVLILFILFCLAIKGVIDFIGWWKGKLDAWRKRTNDGEDKFEGLDKRISSVEDRVLNLEKNDEKMVEQVSDIHQKLSDMYEENKMETVASFRSMLYRLSEDIKSRDPVYITDIEYETFKDAADIYVKRGGNHTMRDVIIPEIEALYRKQNEISSK